MSSVSWAMRCCLSSGMRGERAHVVQAVGELDDEHAQVAGHRDQHLAHRGRLLGLARVELDALELGDAVDDRRDLAAEVGLDVGERDLGVLDGVVEQGGGDGDLVEADVGDDAGHGERVVDVALAARAQLAAMGLGGDLVGAVDRGDRRLRVAAAVAGQQRRQLGGRGRLVVAPPGQDAIDGAPSAPQYCASDSRRGGRRARPGRRGRRSRSGTRCRRSRRRASRPGAAVAAAVPPVASTSSMTRIRSSGWMASRWISSLSVPYSSWYSSRTTAHGSLPALRTGTNAGAEAVGDGRGEDEARAPRCRRRGRPRRRRSGRRARRSPGRTPPASPSSGVMSRNVTPGCG